MTLLIRTTSLKGFHELVARLNGNADALLRRFNIEPKKVKNLQGVLPFQSAIHLIEEAARQLDCPDFGLRLAQQQDLMILGPLAAVALNAPTVGDALRAIINCLHYYVGGLHMALDSDGEAGHSALSFGTAEGLPVSRQRAELTLGVAQKALMILGGDDFRPQAVWLKSDTPLHDNYQAFFDAPIIFSKDRDALLLSAGQLEKKIDQNDPLLHQYLSEYINDTLRDRPMNLEHQVVQLIYWLMPIQRCSLQEVANQLGLHKRTLQRRLADCSIIFEELLDGIRREHAESYLSEPDMPMTQIAALLGYREQSSFNRACRRWFGTTPLKIRRQLQGRAAAGYSAESEMAGR